MDENIKRKADGIQDGIKSARALHTRGQYADAAEQLQSVIHQLGANIRLVVELGANLFAQGLFEKTVGILDEHLDHHEPSEDLFAAAGQIIRCLSQFFMTSQFRESLQQADEVYEGFLDGPQSEIVSDASVMAEVYYSSFWKLAADCGSLDASNVWKVLLPRLKASFHVLQNRGDYFNCWAVAKTYRACSNARDKDSLIEQLEASDKTPAIYRAQARLMIAQAEYLTDDRAEQDRLFTLALQTFRDEQHAYGPLDVEISMMCRLPLDPDDDTFGERISSLFKRYEALNYPVGLARSYIQLLSLAHGLNHLQTESLALDDLESLFEASASKLNWLMIRISRLAMQCVRGGSYGKTIEGAESLWHDLVSSDCAMFRGQAAQLASQAYFALKDQDMRTVWSQRAQKDLSEANLPAMSLITEGFDLNTTQGLSRYFETIPYRADLERLHLSPEAVVEKIEPFIDQSFLHKPNDPQSLQIIGKAIQMFEETIFKTTDPKAKPVRLAKLRQAQAHLFTFKASPRLDIDFEVAALEALKEARGLLVEAKQLGKAVIILQQEALLHVGIAQKFERFQDPEAEQAWQNALKQYKVALDSAQGLGLSFLAVENAYWVAFCEYRRWVRGWTTPKSSIEALLAAEALMDRKRQELSILRGMAAITSKGRLSSDEHSRQLYVMAIQVCVSTGDMHDAWSWVQKSKARSLSDLLGLGVLVPLEITEKIQQDATCRPLFEKEHGLAMDLAAAPDTERFRMSMKLEEHQKTMREQPLLAELLGLREGVPITLSDLLGNARETYALAEDNVSTVFVDFFATGSDLSMFVVRRGELPVVRKLSVSMRQVDAWVSLNLNGSSTGTKDNFNAYTLSGLREEDRTDEGPLRELDALIDPLFELSRPEDLLVFCPTGALHALPLHALHLGPSKERQTLIARNPVVYCASLTSFSQCCRRAGSEATEGSSNRFLAVYEQEPERQSDSRRQFTERERRQIYASTERLAFDLNGESLCGENVTVEAFRSSLESVDLMHFFGHYDYTLDLTADQSVLLFGQTERTGESLRATQVSVKDMFDYRLKVSHVSLLACASAVQRFQAGDEPLGLVTALLCAGAKSVLGTLWPVQSSTARQFSELFYYHLLRSKRPVSGVYSLAHALREAILDVKQMWDFRQPYHWASFVLHGAWFFSGQLPPSLDRE